MGNFLCGVGRVTRFVKVQTHYIFLKRNVDVAPPGKICADAHAAMP